MQAAVPKCMSPGNSNDASQRFLDKMLKLDEQ